MLTAKEARALTLARSLEVDLNGILGIIEERAKNGNIFAHIPAEMLPHDDTRDILRRLGYAVWLDEHADAWHVSW